MSTMAALRIYTTCIARVHASSLAGLTPAESHGCAAQRNRPGKRERAWRHQPLADRSRGSARPVHHRTGTSPANVARCAQNAFHSHQLQVSLGVAFTGSPAQPRRYAHPGREWRSSRTGALSNSQTSGGSQGSTAIPACRIRVSRYAFRPPYAITAVRSLRFSKRISAISARSRTISS
jgi:hypothetical protein